MSDYPYWTDEYRTWLLNGCQGAQPAVQAADYRPAPVADTAQNAQRIGTDQRNRCVAYLGEMYAHGYLSLEEFEKRSDRASAAVYSFQLHEALSELPPPPPESPPQKSPPQKPSAGKDWLFAAGGLLVLLLALYGLAMVFFMMLS